MESFWVVLWLSLSLLLFVKLSDSNQSPGSVHQRCRSIPTATCLNSENGTLTLLLDDIQTTRCGSCPPKTLPEEWNGGKVHVVLILSTTKTFERSMVLAAGLLTRGIRLTIMSNDAESSPSEEHIRSALLPLIPCTIDAIFGILHQRLLL